MNYRTKVRSVNTFLIILLLGGVVAVLISSLQWAVSIPILFGILILILIRKGVEDEWKNIDELRKEKKQEGE